MSVEEFDDGYFYAADLKAFTDFKADPANRGKGRTNAVAAWERIKSVPGPKTYEAYAALEPGRRKVGGSE